MFEDIIGHIPFLRETCLKLEAQTILELGVRDGGSTRAFLDVARILGTKVISVDIEDCSKVSDSPNWEFHQVDDMLFDFKEPVDVLFIDTSHTYEHTLNELRKFTPLVKKDGVILLHDTVHCPEVYKAITDFLAENPNKYQFENRENCNGLGILWQEPR